MKKLPIALVISCLPIFALAAEKKDPTFHYKNQRGSELNITLHETSQNAGKVTGTFKTMVASANCHDVIGKPKELTGFYTGNALTLSISYPSCGATVSIAGNFNKNKEIETMWIVANQGLDTEGKNWNTRLIGYDKYTQHG